MKIPTICETHTRTRTQIRTKTYAHTLNGICCCCCRFDQFFFLDVFFFSLVYFLVFSFCFGFMVSSFLVSLELSDFFSRLLLLLMLFFFSLFCFALINQKTKRNDWLISLRIDWDFVYIILIKTPSGLKWNGTGEEREEKNAHTHTHTHLPEK